MGRRLSRAVLAAVVASLSAAFVHAAPVTAYEVALLVERVSTVVPGLPAVGDTIRGGFSYVIGTPNDPRDPEEYPSAVASLNLAGVGQALHVPGGTVAVHDYSGPPSLSFDQFVLVSSLAGAAVSGYTPATFLLRLRDESLNPDAITGPDIPESLELSAFNSATFQLDYVFDRVGVTITGTVTLLEVTTVPEPSVMVLIALPVGLVTLAERARRRRLRANGVPMASPCRGER